MKTLNLKEAASVLHMSPDTLQRKAHQGQVPGAKIGRSWVFHEELLEEFLRSEIDRQMKTRQGAANDEDQPVNEEPASEPVARIRPRRVKRPLPVLPEA